MKRHILGLGFLLVGVFAGLAQLNQAAFAFGEPQHSKIDASVERKGDDLTFTFKVVPQNGMVINMDGPWKLEFTKAESLKLNKKSFDKDEMSESMPGYTVKAQQTGVVPKGGHMAEYRLTAFVCTKDKSQCFREVHKNTVAW